MAIRSGREREGFTCRGPVATQNFTSSARISTHIALATKPDFMVAKPGDEALMIQRNEMARTLDLVRYRRLAS